MEITKNPISKKRTKLIESEKDYKNFTVGEFVNFLDKTDDDQIKEVEILKIDGDRITILAENYSYKRVKLNVDISLLSKIDSTIGFNPFVEKKRVTYLMKDIDCILSELNLFDDRGELRKNSSIVDGELIGELNFNPFIFNKNGNKVYYQRDLVWKLKDKQNLISSIYNNNSCGNVLIRKHDYDDVKNIYRAGNKDICFKDVVDGKQRLSTLIQFVKCEFKDEFGNYFSDFSLRAQRKFYSSMIFGFAVIENATDEEILEHFITTNTSGVKQSKENLKRLGAVNEIY